MTMEEIKTPSSVWDIDRNDIDACIHYYNTHGITLSEGAVMLQLQDDPEELEKIMKEQGWKARGQEGGAEST